MGSEDHFHRRKAKLRADLKRRAASLRSFDRVLIVCEGEKTEPQYLNELKNYYELPNANVEVDGTCGSDPISVFNHAKRLYEASKRDLGGRTYDRVYCVFDQDSYHLPENRNVYQQCIEKIRNLKPSGIFKAVPSVPCFEYWLLLHFTYTTAAICRKDKKSPGNLVEELLKSYWPSYSKGKAGTFEYTFKNLETAKTNSLKALAIATKTETDNPTTLIHELVEYLQNLNKRE